MTFLHRSCLLELQEQQNTFIPLITVTVLNYCHEPSLTGAMILKGQICVIMNQTVALMMKTHHINYPVITRTTSLVIP